MNDEVFKHSCDRGPHAGSKSMETSGVERLTECYLLIVSYRERVEKGYADVNGEEKHAACLSASPATAMFYIKCIPHLVKVLVHVYSENLSIKDFCSLDYFFLNAVNNEIIVSVCCS